jgi:hypothetical protein
MRSRLFGAVIESGLREEVRVNQKEARKGNPQIYGETGLKSMWIFASKFLSGRGLGCPDGASASRIFFGRPAACSGDSRQDLIDDEIDYRSCLRRRG